MSYASLLPVQSQLRPKTHRAKVASPQSPRHRIKREKKWLCMVLLFENKTKKGVSSSNLCPDQKLCRGKESCTPLSVLVRVASNGLSSVYKTYNVNCIMANNKLSQQRDLSWHMWGASRARLWGQKGRTTRSTGGAP